MKNSQPRMSKRVGMLSATVAALGLVFGLAFVAPAGAQDGGDNYTTVGPTGDATGGTTSPADAGADSAVPPSGPSAPGGTTGGGLPGDVSTGGAVPGGGTTGAAIPASGVPASGVPIASSGPLARTGFGATLPSLLATALVAGGAMLVITVARRRRSN